MDTWIVQYDRLWTTRSSREAHSTTNAKGITAHRIQCCSSFFVLDHAVGNAQRNTESVFLGIMSSSVHGVVLVLLSIIPNIMACFFTEWKTIVFAMTCVHLVSGMGYGMAYYFNMRYWQRRFLLYAHLGCSFVSGSHTLFYLWSSALFILTRPFVMPDEAARVESVARLATWCARNLDACAQPQSTPHSHPGSRTRPKPRRASVARAPHQRAPSRMLRRCDARSMRPLRFAGSAASRKATAGEP